jgi:hypothetical protein
MECPKCGSENMRVWVEVCMYIDPSDYGKLTKKAIAKKTTEIWAMNDNKTTFICKDCCYSSR